MSDATLDNVIAQIETLSPLDKVRVVEHVMSTLKTDIQASEPKQPRKSLKGIWEGVSISEEDIAEARRKM